MNFEKISENKICYKKSDFIFKITLVFYFIFKPSVYKNISLYPDSQWIDSIIENTTKEMTIEFKTLIRKNNLIQEQECVKGGWEPKAIIKRFLLKGT